MGRPARPAEVRVTLKKERLRIYVMDDEKVQERHLMQMLQALDWVLRDPVGVDHFPC